MSFLFHFLTLALAFATPSMSYAGCAGRVALAGTDGHILLPALDASERQAWRNVDLSPTQLFEVFDFKKCSISPYRERCEKLVQILRAKVKSLSFSDVPPNAPSDDFKAQAAELLARVPHARLSEVVSLAINVTLSWNDPHARIEPKQLVELRKNRNTGERRVGLGIFHRNFSDFILISRVVPKSPAEITGVRPYDHVLKIGGHAVTGLAEREIGGLFQGREGEAIELQIRRRDRIFNVSVPWGQVDAFPVNARLLDCGGMKIGVIEITTFDATGIASMVHREIERLTALGMDRLILDLRENPGGDAGEAVNVANLFAPPGRTIAYPKRISDSGTIYTGSEFHTRRSPQCDVPVVALVSRWTASAAELLAGFLQEGRAYIVGETSTGKSVGQAVKPTRRFAGPFREFDLIEFSTESQWLRPSGTTIQGVGMTVDFESPFLPAVEIEGLARKQWPPGTGLFAPLGPTEYKPSDHALVAKLRVCVAEKLSVMGAGETSGPLAAYFADPNIRHAIAVFDCLREVTGPARSYEKMSLPVPW